MSRQILIQDPCHEYAVRFIRHFAGKYGYRAVCFYTDPQSRLEHEREFPELRSDDVAAVYQLRATELHGFAQQLRARHDVAAVVPFSEPGVLLAAEIASALSLDWAQPEVMRLFRDKFALKQHLRAARPDIRVNASWRVGTSADVFDAMAACPEGFVLKPNDGFGNRDIGRFGPRADRAGIDAYLTRMLGREVVMEQYVGGTEYFVNGQVDAQGHVEVVAVFEYVRVSANGRHNLDFETLLVPYASDLFAELASYAARVVEASGLRRNPFHLELKRDGRGPCLIEVGARLAGKRNAFLCGELHGGGLDLFDLAAHYYLAPTPYGPLALDWKAYDAHAVRYVHGIATRRAFIYELRGVAEVEAMPEFAGWVQRPELGQEVAITVDALSMPWSVVLRAASQADAAAAAAEVRRLLRWNETPRVWKPAGLRARARLRMMGLRLRSTMQMRATALRGRPRAEPMPAISDIGSLIERARARVARVEDALARRLQLLPIDKVGRVVRTQPPAPLTPERVTQANAVLEWAQQYLARPHPGLGRKGPICPFVQHTIDLDRFLMSFHDEIDGTSARHLRRVVLDETDSFQRRYPAQGREGGFTSVVLVFPNLPETSLELLDRVHDELKSHLMSRDIMFSPFHARCAKPSISNAEFPVYRAPFPAFAIRHMDVRDIAFVGWNRAAFERYRERYGSLYAQGKVSDEFGYVRLYQQACGRFDLPGVSPVD